MTDPNENRPGYKKTKVGWIPKNWESTPLSQLAELQTGLAKGKGNIADPVSLSYLRVANVQDGHVRTADLKKIAVARSQIERYRLKKNDVLFTEGGDFDKLGRGCVWDGSVDPCLHQNHVFAVRCNPEQLLPYILAAIAAGPHGRRYFTLNSKQSTNLASINSTQLKAFPIPLPPLSEQQKIAEILSTWDDAIEQTRVLIEAKKKQKKALMQQLLTGKRRLPGFGPTALRTGYRFFDLPCDWDCPHIGDVAHERSERCGNTAGTTVLSCSKHKGFVESSEYFGKRVHSEDTSNYKVIRCDWFGYPSNHIEEGSIGFLTSHEVGIVSPIYTVFETNDAVYSPYLYAVFKTETFRHIFEVSTNASVDRRGSLRWDAFSGIRIPCPTLEEQRAIAAVLDAADSEISSLDSKLEALQRQKKGLMQRLLTGQVRVKG